MLIRSFMTHGHLVADLDPLELEKTYQNFDGFADKFKFPSKSMKELVDYKYYGFAESDLDREFYIDAP